MKKVIIIRHAKSSWNDFNLSDFDRPLDSRGTRDAPIMAKRLQATGIQLHHLYSSTALRAKSTAEYFGTIFNTNINLIPDLYHGEPSDYLEIIHQLEEEIKVAAFFGHNPGITHIANLIKPGCTDNIPTCGIIIADLPDELWQKTHWRDMKLESLMFPKDNQHD